MRNLSISFREAWKSDGKGTFRKYRPQSRLVVVSLRFGSRHVTFV